MSHKILRHYPFQLEDVPRVMLAEGFEAYDGVLKDTPGSPHKGIDYVRWDEDEDKYRCFPVFNMHEGWAWCGISVTWGCFVAVYARPQNGAHFRTVYAHLKRGSIPDWMPVLPGKPKHHDWPADPRQGHFLHPVERIGETGITGNAKQVVQLHIELHAVDEASGEMEKLDPYGLYARASSRKYPQPGATLKGFAHYWTSDNPPFAT